MIENNKKFDYNSLIGLVLMGALMLGYLWYTQPTKEELAKQELAKIEAEKVEKELTQNNVQNNIVLDSTQLANQVVAKLETIENEKLELIVNSKGGVLNSVRLKDFKSYAKKEEDKKDVFLINNNNAYFNIKLESTTGTVNTNALVFSSELKQSPEKDILILTNNTNGKVVKFIYTILKDDYLVDFNIQTVGYQLTNALLDWEMKGFTHEKGKTWEQTQSEIYYSYDNNQSNDYFTSSSGNEENVNWIAFRQQFFTAILLADTPFKKAAVSIENNDEEHFTKNYEANANLALSGTEINTKLQWYLGPVDYDILKSYDKNLTLVNDFGWGIFGWLNKHFFLNIFKALESTGLSYGLIILLMTVVVKLLLSPVTYKQYLSSAKMKVLKPEIEEITKKYPGKDNALKRQQETMSLYSKAGASPMAGCLPALLQIPVFYALFNFFPSVINLRQKSFLWADDLTAYDSILDLGFSIPIYGDHISLFTILYAVVMFIYMRVSGQGNMQAPQQEGMPNMKYMMYLMPLMFIVWLNNYASGLSYYYFLSNLINIGLIIVIKKFIIDDDKIHAKIQANKAKPKKTSKFGAKMQEIMKQAEAEKKRRGQ